MAIAAGVESGQFYSFYHGRAKGMTLEEIFKVDDLVTKLNAERVEKTPGKEYAVSDLIIGDVVCWPISSSNFVHFGDYIVESICETGYDFSRPYAHIVNGKLELASEPCYVGKESSARFVYKTNLRFDDV